MTVITATRYHDFSAGHRVVGHESKCRHLHGHNYRVHFFCKATVPDFSQDVVEITHSFVGLDNIGRVIDFSVIKERLCMWLENNWDHKFLHWQNDPVIGHLENLITDRPDKDSGECEEEIFFMQSVVPLSFNPTAENMAVYLGTVIGPKQLEGTGVTLCKVIVEETAKCSASWEL